MKFRRSLLAIVLSDVYTVSERVKQYGPHVKDRLAPDFAKIDAPYPPDQVCLIGLKKEKILELWVADKDSGL